MHPICKQVGKRLWGCDESVRRVGLMNTWTLNGPFTKDMFRPLPSTPFCLFLDHFSMFFQILVGQQFWSNLLWRTCLQGLRVVLQPPATLYFWVWWFVVFRILWSSPRGWIHVATRLHRGCCETGRAWTSIDQYFFTQDSISGGLNVQTSLFFSCRFRFRFNAVDAYHIPGFSTGFEWKPTRFYNDFPRHFKHTELAYNVGGAQHKANSQSHEWDKPDQQKPCVNMYMYIYIYPHFGGLIQCWLIDVGQWNATLW